MPSDTKYFTRLPPHSVTKETSLLCVRGVTMLATTKCILRSRIKPDFGKSEHGFSLIQSKDKLYPICPLRSKHSHGNKPCEKKNTMWLSRNFHNTSQYKNYGSTEKNAGQNREALEVLPQAAQN